MESHDLWKEMEEGFQKALEHAEQTGENPEDMLIGMPFGTEREHQIQSIQEHNASGDVMPFVCLRKSFGPPAVPNCHTMECDGCGEKVWMSPATKLTFDKIDKKLILCIECCQKRFTT